ncbi:MAG: tRNA guanosine(34) transglycosylase Tgt [Candidatus Woesebacteria bacterium]
MKNFYLPGITIKNKTYQFPIYLPDATLGVVRNLSSFDLVQAGIEGVVINTYHLRQNPGYDVLEKAKGIKNFMNWSGLTASDSGGFQLFSLINKNPKLGKVTDKGVIIYSGTKQRKKELFTAEKSIQVQFAIDSDIMICLDDFTPPEADKKRLKASVGRTIEWAKRSKAEFEKQIKKRKLSDKNRPLLFAVIQGYRDQALRKYCAQKLLQIGFDGYGLGGWPFDEAGNFDYETCELNAKLSPDDLPRFALGVGSPENIRRLVSMGYHIFDCVLPTRDARHGRLYSFSENPKKININNDEHFYQYLYINRGKYAQDFSPISDFCDCPACQYSKAYLHHLFKIQDGLGWHLATMHNLHFYSRLIRMLREKVIKKK